MVQIYAHGQSGSGGVELELMGASVEMNFQIQDISDLTAVQAPHSNTFQLPFTRTNNQFFGHYYEANIATGTFSAYAETTAEVLNDGRIIFQGVLQLLEVDTQAMMYRCVVFSSTASLFEKIRGKNWADFFRGDDINPYTDLDHALIAANIIDSWYLSQDITLGAVGAGVIVYPMTDNALHVYNEDQESQWWGEQGQSGAGGPSGQSAVFSDGIRQMRPFQFRPAIQVKWLFNEIVKRCGFVVQSNFFDTADFEKIYMFLGTQTERVVGRNTYSAKVGLTANQTIITQEGFLNQFLPTNEASPNFDPDNHFASGVFVAPFTGSFQFIWAMEITSPAGVGTYSFVTVAETPQTVFTDEVSYSRGTTEQYFRYFWKALAVGQELRFYTNVYGVGSATIIAGENTYVQMVNYQSGSVGIVDVIANFPKMSVDTWMKSIITKFNLVVAPAPKESVFIKCEPWPDFVAVSDKTKDWTNKVDWNASMVMKPTTNDQKKVLIFSDAEGNDYKNKEFQELNKEVYGTYRYENPNAFATDEETIGGTYVPHHLSLLRRTNPSQFNYQYRWHHLFQYEDGDDKPATGGPILAFYHGLKSIPQELWIDGVDTSFHSNFTIYSDYITNEDSWSLAWHPHPYQFWALGEPTDYGCYRKFWAAYINELYSEDCRILECTMYLTTDDIRNLEWSDSIWILDSYWRVISISGWNADGDKPAKVTLQKVLEKGAYDCDVIIDRFEADGTITFTDTEGNPASGTAKCCVRYGYLWDSEIGECFWRVPGGGHDNEDPIGTPTDTGPTNPIPGTEPPYPFEGQETVVHTGTTGDVPIAISSFQLTTLTTNATPTEAVEIKSGKIYMGQEGIYSMRITVVATEVGGTSGTIGHTHHQEWIGTAQVVQNVARIVGQHMIAEVKSTGGGAKTITLSAISGYPSEFRILVSGANNVDVMWAIDVTMYRISTIKRMIPDVTDEGDALWENSDEILFEDGVFMNWE